MSHPSQPVFILRVVSPLSVACVVDEGRSLANHLDDRAVAHADRVDGPREVDADAAGQSARNPG